MRVNLADLLSLALEMCWPRFRALFARLPTLNAVFVLFIYQGCNRTRHVSHTFIKNDFVSDRHKRSCLFFSLSIMTPLVYGTMLVLSVLALSNIGAVHCQEITNAVRSVEVGRMRFSFHTDKPEIKLFPKKDDQKEWYSIVFTHLEEYDKDRLVIITDAAFGTNFTYSNTTTSGDGSNHVHNLNMSAYIPSGSSFCRVVISNFITEKQVTDGGDPTTTHAWQFNIQMDGWSFHDVENLLRFHFSVYSSQSKGNLI